MEVTLFKDDNIKINFKKNKEPIEIILFSNSTLEINGFKIDSPGEYEVKEIFVENIVFLNEYIENNKPGGEDEKFFSLLNTGDIKVCYLSNKVKELNPEEVEQIGEINLLVINIEKFYDKKEGLQTVHQIISQIEPQITIPVYKNKEYLKEFLKIRGISINETEFLSKFSINSKNLTEEKSKIIILKAFGS